jgi:leader peptidase (prepilin peptidase) / N-methyltransferase
VNPIFAIPMEARLTAIFAIGVCIGGAVNLAIYRLAWFPRSISPWSRPDPSAPPRRLADRIPIFGWLGLRREAGLHGPGFWIRPMLLELFVGLGLAWLYWWEIGSAGLLPPPWRLRPLPAGVLYVLHVEFAAHVVLIALMLAASMIDVDEMIIPDEITVSGTLVALLAAAAWPWSLLPHVTEMGQLDFLHLTSPNFWLEWLEGFPQYGSLALGLACWWLWCLALLPRTWRTRHGWWRATQLCLARIVREPVSFRILRMAAVGSLVIVLIWYRVHFGHTVGWEALLSALVGMAAGGGIVWMVRIVASAALRREAMGFGDVTLMAMVGAFLGWQPCLVIFFLAPFAGLVVGIVRLILFRDKEIPYGPFLCLATLVLIVNWNAIWDYTHNVFSLGWIVAVVMLFCLALMALMLLTWRLIRHAFRS